MFTNSEIFVADTHKFVVAFKRQLVGNRLQAKREYLVCTSTRENLLAVKVVPNYVGTNRYVRESETHKQCVDVLQVSSLNVGVVWVLLKKKLKRFF